MAVNRRWKSDDLKKAGKVPKAKKIFRDDGTIDSAETRKMVYWFYQWARDMHEWGQAVREDIRRIEKYLALAAGDPGDPPAGPPPDEGEE